MEYIETTININKHLLGKINSASRLMGKSKTEIIVILLKKVMVEGSSNVKICRSVKYQDCDEKKNWHTFHIVLKSDEYEYFLDLRKILKMSVSFIVAYAVRKYLKSFLKSGFTDNNSFQNYILAREDADGIIYWLMFWGVPKNLEKHLTFRGS
ncbi:hypothetical protein ACFL20_04845 [Spirochaetota bacterium]